MGTRADMKLLIKAWRLQPSIGEGARRIAGPPAAPSSALARLRCGVAYAPETRRGPHPERG